MKLVTFHHSGRGDRVGAVTADGSIVDLNAAYALYLRNVEQEGAFYALADARVPAEMRGLFENGDRGLDAARAALEYALKEGPGTTGPDVAEDRSKSTLDYFCRQASRQTTTRRC